VNVSRIEKALTCAECKQHSEVFEQESDIPILLLDEYVTDADIQEWQKIESHITKKNWIDFTYDGITFGRYWAYDTILERKTDQFDTDNEVFNRYKSEAKSGFLAYKAGKRMQQQFHVLNVGTHSFQYGINRSFLAAFEEKTTNLFSFTQAGLITQNDDYIAVTKTDKFRYLARDPKIVPLMSEPINEKSLQLLEVNALNQIQSSHAWAVSVPRSKLSSREIREKLNLRPGVPIICILTSSPDEAMAANVAELLDKDALRIDDALFLQNCLDVARECSELNFVIRVHPRLSINKRENRVSPWLEPLLTMLENRPSNVFLNKPGDGIGLYDIAMVSDAVLNYRSTAGAEMLMLGIPVILTDPSQMRSYPPFLGLNSSQNDVLMISRKLRDTLQNFSAKNHIVYTQRWLSQSNGNAYARINSAIGSPVTEVPQLNVVRKFSSSSARQTARKLLRKIKVVKYLVLVLRLIENRNSARLEERISEYLKYRSVPKSLFENTINENKWDDVPNISNESILQPEIEEIEITIRLNQTIIKYLEPWDGHEGAISNLKRFPN
jgi:hypothetical protein